jgi:hypothetical protein
VHIRYVVPCAALQWRMHYLYIGVAAWQPSVFAQALGRCIFQIRFHLFTVYTGLLHNKSVAGLLTRLQKQCIIRLFSACCSAALKLSASHNPNISYSDADAFQRPRCGWWHAAWTSTGTGWPLAAGIVRACLLYNKVVLTTLYNAPQGRASPAVVSGTARSVVLIMLHACAM